jgi:hypothetical protein
MLSIFVLSLIFCHVFAEAKTRIGGSRGTSSSVAKPSTSTPKTSLPKSNSGSTTNTPTKSPYYSSLTKKYPKSTRYFSGNVLSKTLVFGTVLLMLNDSNDVNVEPTYSDEEGYVYTLADLEEMEVQIPEDELVEDDLYSDTVTFDEEEAVAETDTVVPEEIETASSNVNYENETYYEEEENHSFNWLWLILPLIAAVIIGSFLRQFIRKHK